MTARCPLDPYDQMTTAQKVDYLLENMSPRELAMSYVQLELDCEALNRRLALHRAAEIRNVEIRG